VATPALTPLAVSAPTTQPVTIATPVTTPTTEPVQILPTERRVNIELTKDRPTSEIHLQFQGGLGEIFLTKIMMRVYAADGTFTEYTMSDGKKPIPGDEIVAPDTRGNDRCEVFVVSAGTRYKIIDGLATGGGYY
jgi:hypothetical protein